MDITSLFWTLIIGFCTTLMLLLHIVEPDLMKPQMSYSATTLGADFEMVNHENFDQKIRGIQVVNIIDGKLKEATEIQEGFIVTKLNGIKVQSINKFKNLLNRGKGEIVLEGVCTNSGMAIKYAFEL